MYESYENVQLPITQIRSPIGVLNYSYLKYIFRIATDLAKNVYCFGKKKSKKSCNMGIKKKNFVL